MLNNFSSLRLTAGVYILLGILFLLLEFWKAFSNYQQQGYFDSTPLIFGLAQPYLLLFLGLGIMRRMKSVIIISLILLPIIWFIWGFAGILGCSGDNICLFVAIMGLFALPVLFVLTLWSLIAS